MVEKLVYPKEIPHLIHRLKRTNTGLSDTRAVYDFLTPKMIFVLLLLHAGQKGELNDQSSQQQPDCYPNKDLTHWRDQPLKASVSLLEHRILKMSCSAMIKSDLPNPKRH